jgi:DNA-binding transcriptional LysR family regulator
MKPPIDSRQLYAFVILARTGSFTQTARELFLTQSAVSHSIKSLETDMGCRLFDRVGKTVMLTQAGEQLLPHADRILREMDVARGGMTGLRQWGFGRLRVGAPAPIGDSLLPPVMAEVRRREPRTLLKTEVADESNPIDLLEARRVDLVLSPAGKPDERFATETLFAEEYVFAVPREHPWCSLQAAPLEAVGPQPVIVPGLHTITWRFIDEFFRAEQISLNVQGETGTPNQALALAKAGLGAALIPAWSFNGSPLASGLAALPLGRRRLRIPWVITFWRGRRLSLTESLFIEVARQQIAELAGEISPPKKPRAAH